MPRVLIAILTSDRMPYLRRATACEMTWVRFRPDWATIWTLSGPRLGVPDSYSMMSFKTKALFRRAAMTPGWDWLLRVDDDVCVHWGAIKIPEVGLDYVGPEVPVQPGDKFRYCAGAVTWFSRKAVEALVAGMRPAKNVLEDREIGRVLNKAGIFPTFLKVHYVRKHPGDVTDADVAQLKKLGFVLETQSPSNMIQLFNALGLVEAVREERFSESTVMAWEPKTNKVVVPRTEPSVYRDHQGKHIVRTETTFNMPGSEIPGGGAIARPQSDPGWGKKGRG